MTSSHLEISIVNDNNRDLLADCLRSLGPAGPATSWTVSVVDNASVDGSREMLAQDFPFVRVIANTDRRGFGANHNLVIRRVLAERSARYILVLNDDTRLDPGAIDRLVAAMDLEPRTGAMVPMVRDELGRSAATRLAYPTVRSSLRSDYRGFTESPDPANGWLQGSCLMLRTAALAEIGMFDQRFFLFYEDADLSLRLQDARWDLGICAGATLVHRGHATVFRPELTMFTPMQGRHSRYLYFEKHRGLRSALLIAFCGRALLAVRGTRTWLSSVFHRHAERRAQALHFLALAGYDPRRPVKLPARPDGPPPSKRGATIATEPAHDRVGGGERDFPDDRLRSRPMGLSDQRLQARLDELSWYHSIDVAPGVVTRGWFDLRHALPLLPFPDLHGARCLDVGTWDGFYAYEMERRGASEVVAVDLPDLAACDYPPKVQADLTFDPSHTGKQARSAGFHLLHQLLDSKVAWQGVNAYDLDPAQLGRFDFVVVGSLLVHLRDPVRALDAVRRVTGGRLLVADYLHTPVNLLSRRRPIFELRGVGSDFQWWLASDAGLRQLLRISGFEIEDVSKYFLLRPRPDVVPSALASSPKQRMIQAANWALTGDRTARGLLHRAYLARPQI